MPHGARKPPHLLRRGARLAAAALPSLLLFGQVELPMVFPSGTSMTDPCAAAYIYGCAAGTCAASVQLGAAPARQQFKAAALASFGKWLHMRGSCVGQACRTACTMHV